MKASIPRPAACALSLSLLPACGPAPEPARPPRATIAATSVADEAPSAADSEDPALAATGCGGPEEEEPVFESKTLARDLLERGGRRIGYSARWGFVYPIEKRTQESFGLSLYFLRLDGQKKEPLQICQLGECKEKGNEAIKVVLPKLTTRLGDGGYFAIDGVHWPAESDELELAGVDFRLKYSKGTLAAIRKGKPSAMLAQVGGKRIDAPAIQAVFIVPGGKLLGAYSAPKGYPSGPAEDFYIFKMP
jgi:hypothetical protein